MSVIELWDDKVSKEGKAEKVANLYKIVTLRLVANRSAGSARSPSL